MDSFMACCGCPFSSIPRNRHGLFLSRSGPAGRNYRIHYVPSASGATSFCLPQFGRYMSNRGSKLAPPDRFLPNILGDGNKIDRIRSVIDEQACTAKLRRGSSESGLRLAHLTSKKLHGGRAKIGPAICIDEKDLCLIGGRGPLDFAGYRQGVWRSHGWRRLSRWLRSRWFQSRFCSQRPLFPQQSFFL